MSNLTDEVLWGRTKIKYQYEYASRKTLAIHVHPDLTVSVVAPIGTSLEKIREKVLKRGAWIRKSRREFELYLPKQPERKYVIGETHRYLGRQYRIKASIGNMNAVKCVRGYFYITSKAKLNSKKIQSLLDSWYSKKADEILLARYSICCEKVKSMGIVPASLEIRKLKTRWGSCTKAGKIILNMELIKAPTECIDYVIMHELCHLKEHNHGARFWKLLEKIMPDYEVRKNRLNLSADV